MDENNEEETPLTGICLDCGFEDLVENFEMEQDWNEFTHREFSYPVCKCGGGVEVG